MSALGQVTFRNTKFVMAAVALFAFSAPATAGSTTQQTAVKSASSDIAHSDISAAKKKKRLKQARTYQSDGLDYYRARGIVPSMGYIGPPGYPGEYAWRKSIGQCVTDMGYGRWSACGSP